MVGKQRNTRKYDYMSNSLFSSIPPSGFKKNIQNIFVFLVRRGFLLISIERKKDEAKGARPTRMGFGLCLWNRDHKTQIKRKIKKCKKTVFVGVQRKTDKQTMLSRRDLIF
nr:hypothetical protein [Pandoravirus aubagnensis]